MENRRSSVGSSSVKSDSPDMSLYKDPVTNHEPAPIDDEPEKRNYFLRWKGFEGNLLRMVEVLKLGSKLSDVTLSCEGGHRVHLHKIILASASLYFYQIFDEISESKHPIIILCGINSDILDLLINYMYRGYIDVPMDKLSELVSAGKCLRIKGLMDLKEDLSENGDFESMIQPPPAHMSNGGPSSFLMSPMSEPRLTPTISTYHPHPPRLPSSYLWPQAAGDSLQLLATAAHMRSSSEEEERSSTGSPQMDIPAPAHGGHSALNAASAVAASRAYLKRRRDFQLPYFRYDRENEENDPNHGPASNSDNSNHSINDLGDNRAINLSLRTSEPLAPISTNFATTSVPLLNIPNPNDIWQKRDELSAFRSVGGPSSPAAHSSGGSSQNSSPLDFSSWRLGSTYSRFFPRADPSVHFERDNADNNRSALMAVAAAISAAAASAVVSASSERSTQPTSLTTDSASPMVNGVMRRGPRHSRNQRRTSLSGSFKSSSPVNAGANWKSRQPTECEFCKRMFSNKFNLKQHILNMHSTGGEVKCEQCGKMVKNKWYLRRHKVTHHGAPLRKYKKDHDFKQVESDHEEDLQPIAKQE